LEGAASSGVQPQHASDCVPSTPKHTSEESVFFKHSRVSPVGRIPKAHLPRQSPAPTEEIQLLAVRREKPENEAFPPTTGTARRRLAIEPASTSCEVHRLRPREGVRQFARPPAPSAHRASVLTPRQSASLSSGAGSPSCDAVGLVVMERSDSTHSRRAAALRIASPSTPGLFYTI
jgi:hypothetical protein